MNLPLKKLIVILICTIFISIASARSTSRSVHNDRPTPEIVDNLVTPYRAPLRYGKVLFVEDPGYPEFGPITKPDSLWDITLTVILGSGNYGWYGATFAPEENGPTLDTMMQYDLVIWNVYDYWWQDTAALTTTDQDNLGQYMEGGGYVWLIGQDALWSLIPYSWMDTYFGLADAHEDYLSHAESLQIHGLAEIDDITLWSIPDYQKNQFAPDELIPHAGAHAVLEDVDSAKVVGIFYDAGVWLSSFWTVDGRGVYLLWWDEWIAMVTDMLDAFGVLGIGEIPHKVSAQHVRLSIAPSPMTHSTAINYVLDVAGAVSIDVFNPLGQHIATLVKGYREAGSYKVLWHGKDASGIDVPMGMYFVRLICGEYSCSAHLIVLK